MSILKLLRAPEAQRALGAVFGQIGKSIQVILLTLRTTVSLPMTGSCMKLIVLATGFRLDIANAPFDISGLNGVKLQDLWRAPGCKAYMGMAVSGIQNWFIMLGPNTGPGHISVLVYTEAQAGYILKAVQTLLGRDFRYINVRKSKQDAWHEKLQSRMKYTSWKSGCRSWYLDEYGENNTLFPGFASDYVLNVQNLKPEKYDAVVYH